MNLKSSKGSQSKKNTEDLKLQYWGKSLIGSHEEDELNLTMSAGNITELKTGDNHIFIRTQNNSLYGFGDNSLYQIGITNMMVINEVLQVDFAQIKTIENIFCGSATTFIVDDKNNLFAFGLNCSGQLGLGHIKNVKEPTLVKSSVNSLSLQPDEQIKQIVGGGLHTLLTTTKSRIFSTGHGLNYALGHGNNKNSTNFTEIKFFENSQYEISKINSGVNHSGCLINGKLYVWGKFGYDKRCLSPKPNIIPINSDVIDFVMGDALTVMLTDKGEVFTLGDDINGQLGVKNAKLGNISQVKLPQKIEFITCGLNHVIVGNDKMFYGWGSNKDFQLQPDLDKAVCSSPIELNWLYANKPQQIHCSFFQTFILTNKKIDFSLILSPEEKMKEKLQKEVENLKIEYINQKTKNDQLKQNVKKLHDTLSVMSKADNESIKDPYEKSKINSDEDF